MKPVHISQVKPEFRVLGVAATRVPDGFLVIGAVYRGNEVLDDVLSVEGSPSLVDLIAEMLLMSKHNGQVRAILLDDTILPEKVEAETLCELIGRPVLILTDEPVTDSRYMIQYNERNVCCAGIDENSAKRVLDKVCGTSGSESLRLSSIILNRISDLQNV